MPCCFGSLLSLLFISDSTIAAVFAAEFGEEVYAGEQGVGILADAASDIGTGKQCQPVGVHLQADGDNAVRRVVLSMAYSGRPCQRTSLAILSRTAKGVGISV